MIQKEDAIRVDTGLNKMTQFEPVRSDIGALELEVKRCSKGQSDTLTQLPSYIERCNEVSLYYSYTSYQSFCLREH
jgi:hypothetical protein